MINLNQYFASGVHVSIAKSIIRKIASNPLHRSSDTCLKLMQGGYTDALFDDLTQDIAAELVRLNSEGFLSEFTTLFQHRLCFANFVTDKVDDDGFFVVKSSYIRLYKALYVGLARYSQHDTSKGLLSASDLMYTDDNGQDHAITLRASNYIGLAAQQADIEGLFARSDISEFMEFLRYTEKPQKVDDITDIIEGLSEGLSRADIATVYGMTIKRIDYLIKSMRDSWNSNDYKVWLSRRKSYKFGGAISGTVTTYKGPGHGQGHGLRISYILDRDACKGVNSCYTPYVDRFEGMETSTTDYFREIRRGGGNSYDTSEIDKRLAKKGLYKVDGQWRTYKSGYSWREKHTLKRGATQELIKALIQAI